MSIVSHPQGMSTLFQGGAVHNMNAPQAPVNWNPIFNLPGQAVNAVAGNYGPYANAIGGIGSAIGGMGQANQGALANLGAANANAMAGIAGSLANLGGSFANNYGAYGGVLSQIAAAQARENEARSMAMGNAAAANQSGLSNMWTQGLASLGNFGNNAMLAMGQGQQGYQRALADMLGSTQTARAGMQGANQSAQANMFGANAGALANMYGSEANAYGQLGTAESQGLAGMQNANQQAMARNAEGAYGALAGLGGSGLRTLGALGVAGSMPGILGSMPGSSFSATGTQGPIASGSYGGLAGAGGGGLAGGLDPRSTEQLTRDSMGQVIGINDRTAASLMGQDALARGDLLRSGQDSRNRVGMGAGQSRGQLGRDYQSGLSNLMSSNESAMRGLDAANTSAMDRMDRQQDLYRQDYSNMFGQGMLGMLGMGREAANSMRTGMQDFYGNMGSNRTNFNDYLNRATTGFNQNSGDIRGVGRDINDTRRDMGRQLDNMRGQIGTDYRAGLGALSDLTGHLNTGMNTSFGQVQELLKGLLPRFAPTASEQVAEEIKAANMRRRNTGGVTSVPYHTARPGQMHGVFYGGSRAI